MYTIYNILLFINAKYLANAFRFLLQITILDLLKLITII